MPSRLFQRPLTTSCFLAGLLLTSSALTPAWAQTAPIDEKGAAELATSVKAGFTKWLDSSDSPMRITWKGDVKAVPSGDHYAVTLPPVSLLDSDGIRIELDPIEMKMTPRDDGLQTVKVTFPSEINSFNGTVPQSKITIGSQKTDGVWAPAYQTFVTLDSSYANLTATVFKDDGKRPESHTTVDLVEAKMDLKHDLGDVWSGPVLFQAKALSSRDDKNRETLTIGNMKVDGTYNLVNLAKLARLSEIGEKMQKAEGEEETRLLSELLDQFKGLMNGSDGTFTLENMKMVDTDDNTSVSIASMSFSGAVKDMDKPATSVTTGFDLKGLKISISPELDPFLPNGAGLQLSVVNLPSDAMWNTLRELALSPDDSDMATMAMSAMMNAFSAAGAEVRLERLNADSQMTRLNGTGSIKIDPEAAMGAVGQATLIIHGLDEAIKTLAARPASDTDSQEIMASLAMLQLWGKADTDEKGQPIHRYDLVLGKTGDMTLNGNDLSALMGSTTEADGISEGEIEGVSEEDEEDEDDGIPGQAE